MNEQDYNRLRDLSWRRALTPAEDAELQAFLREHPRQRDAWEAEQSLSAALEQLPAAPKVSSNFTARVLQAVEREQAQKRREQSENKSSVFGWFQGWLPKAATALLVIGSVLVVHHQREISNRTALARNVASMTQAVSASGPDLLQDFESIRHLDDSQMKADTELLALFK